MALSESQLALLPCYNSTDLDLDNTLLYKEMFHCSYLNINMSTCLPVESVETQETISTLCRVTEQLFTVCFWGSSATGVLGNSLAILTINSLPVTTATFYVRLLAVSDLLAILVRVFFQLMIEKNLIDLDSSVFNIAALSFDYFASYSNWLLVLICFERFLTIRFPLKKRTYFTMPRAKLAALAMAVSLLLTYILATWRLGYHKAEIFTLRNLLYSLLPLCLIFLTILLIWGHLWRVHQDREATFSSSHTSRSSRPGSESSCASAQNNALISGASETAVNLAQAVAKHQAQCTVNRKSKTTLQDIARLENSLTAMMLLAAVVFMVLTVPHCATWFIYRNSIDQWRSPLSHAQFYLLNNIALVLTFFNLSINFILYFLSAKKFRTQLYKLFRRGVWVKALFEVKTRCPQTPTFISTQQESLPVDPIANGEPVSLRLLSGTSSNGTIRLKSTGKVQFTLDQSYYD